VSEATTVPPVPQTHIRLVDACEVLGVGYSKLRAMAVDQKEFTVRRDGKGKGFVIFLRRDEVAAYDEGGLDGLRKFRAKKGRK
jgi:hypothetical protein